MPIATDPPRASRLQLRLGTGVFAGAALLLALTIGLGVAYATWKANRVAEERLRRDLAAVPAIFGGYAASQADARRSQVRSLVEESGTKALLGEGGASAETAHDSAAGFARALGAGAVFLFDARGALISRSDRGVGEEAGRDFSDVSWVRDPLVELSPATAYILDVTRTRTLSLVASAPVTQGEKSEMKLNGVLAAAFPMTDERAREVALLAAGDAAFLANLAPRDVPPALEVVAASEGLKSAGLRAGLAEARDVFPRLFRDGQVYGPFDFALDGEVWVGTALPIKSGRGEPIAALLVARGKKAELAPFVGISRGIAAVGVAILLVFFPLSFLLAHRASRSIEQLAEAAAAIGEGRAPSLPRSRWKEVGALTRAFGSMVRELGVRDSERRRAEEVTAGWKNRYEAAIFASGQILYDWEPETNAVTFGGATERILGIAASRLTGGRAAWSERVHPEDREAFRAETERVLSEREPFHLEYRVRREDGAYVSVRDEGYFVRRAAGESERMVGFVVDVTQERRLEEHVRQSQRIEAVGRLAGGIAHDFNNLLTVIQGTTSLLLQRCEEADEELRQDLNEILRASERATAMTRQLLAFSRRQVVRVETADLNAVVAEMQKMLRRLIGENIELVTVAGGGALPVRVDLTQIEQVVMNLVVNARDAMPRGGRLTIETGAVEVGEGEAQGARPGPHATLSVKDTGIGMTKELRSHIFEPFFTTKPAGKGTGLGLATAFAIVRQCDGVITVDSEPDRGSTFRIFLPIVEAPAIRAEAASLAEPAPRGSERVLLVEDEEAVRRLARRVLVEQGYGVLEAATADEALDLVRRGTGPIDLVLTDVVMPGMSGPDLARSLEGLLPGVPVLFMSGHAEDALPGPRLDGARADFLPKPLTPGDLARKVRERLDERAT